MSTHLSWEKCQLFPEWAFLKGNHALTCIPVEDAILLLLFNVCISYAKRLLGYPQR